MLKGGKDDENKLYQCRGLVPFADEILGRRVSFSDPDFELKNMRQIQDTWNGLWMRGRR
ncbi:MAG TPA: hypothetical protein VGB25_01410 [Candidatus Binatia bacterium]